MRNLLISGENYDALTALLVDFQVYKKIKLVYIDPPYGTNQDFTFTNNRFSTISRINGGKIAYKDSLAGSEYLQFLSGRLKLIKTLMADDASIYIHIDNKMGHYVKVLMDEIFGQNNFINDITRIKCNPKNFQRRGYGNIKDMVLFYSKGNKYIWNDSRKLADIEKLKQRYNKTDKLGRRYTTTPLHAPGETINGETGKRWKDMDPPPGRHWRYPPDVLDKLDKAGLIEWSSTGNPRKKIFLDDVLNSGTKVQDIWNFKDPQNPKYPTEKNLDMLKMIINASSNVGDLILDAFCGSGTTLVAAQELGRKWIGIDSSLQAINICSQRLNDFEFIKLDRSQVEDEYMVEEDVRSCKNPRLFG